MSKFDVGPYEIAKTSDRRNFAPDTDETPSNIDVMFKQSFEDARRVSNAAAYALNLANAYDEVNDKIAAATGVKDIHNPLMGEGIFLPIKRRDEAPRPIPEGMNAFDAWRARVNELRQSHPDLMPWDTVLDEPGRKAWEKMKSTREASNALEERIGLSVAQQRPWLGPVDYVVSPAEKILKDLWYQPGVTAASFAGGFAGQFVSLPDAVINLISGAAGGKSVSIVKNAVLNAGFNMGGQLPLSTLKQWQYKEAGLPYGADVVTREVAGAGAAGFILDAGVRTAARVPKYIAGDTKGLGGFVTDAPKELPLPPTPTVRETPSPELIARAQADDLEAIKEYARMTGADEIPGVKGAIHYAETTGRFDDEIAATFRKENIEPSEGMRVLSEATRGALDNYIRPPEAVRQAEAPLMRDLGERIVTEREPELRAALAGLEPRLQQMVEQAVEAGIPRVVKAVEAHLDAIKKGEDTPSAERFAGILERAAQDEGGPERLAAMVSIHAGNNLMQTVAAMRNFPDLVDTNVSMRTETMQAALAISKLEPEAFALFQSGEASPGVARVVSDLVPPDQQARVMDDMRRAGVETEADARQVVRDLVRPARDASDVDTPLSRGSKIDDPAGPEAKAQTDRLMKEHAEAVKEAQAPIKAREKLESEIEDAKGEVAKIEQGDGKAKADDIPEHLFALSDEDIAKLGEAHGKLRDLQAQHVEASRGSPLFSLVLDAARMQRRRDIHQAINAALRLADRVLPEGVKVELRSSELRNPETGEPYPNRGAGEVVATSHPITGDIELATYAMNPAARLSHEAVHTLVTRGLLSPEEVALLAKAGRKAGVFETEAAYREAYKGRANLDRQIEEEAAAHYIDAIVSRQISDGVPRNLIQKIQQIIERIRNVLNGYGFRTETDVVRAILEGDAAARKSVQSWMRSSDVAAVAVNKEKGKLFAFGGEKAETANLDALSRAKDLEASGMDRDNIWKLTGWGRGVDGKWRFEIDDSDAGFSVRGSMRRQDGIVGERFEHPDLYEAYPALRALDLFWDPELDPKTQLGGYDQTNGVISIAAKLPSQWTVPVLLHELQHGVQEMERFGQGASMAEMAVSPARVESWLQGWDGDIIVGTYFERDITMSAAKVIDGFDGGNLEQLRNQVVQLIERGETTLEAASTKIAQQMQTDAYWRNSGEVEARLVETRMDMTPEQRRERPFWYDYDILEAEQTVKRQGMMYAMQDAATGREMRRELDALGFYSQALEAAKALKQNKGTPEQMRAQLRSAGVKEAELVAVGLDGFLEGKKSVTKAELVGFIEQNRVQVKEAFYQTAPSRIDEGDVTDWPTRDASGPAKWQSYSIDPSNPTYRETVIHLPAVKPDFAQFKAESLANGVPEADIERNYQRLVNDPARMAREDKANFRSGHWQEPNVIAHARTSLQKTADGKTVFLVDELQSDWGQKLRDGGVRDEAKIAELRARVEAADKRAAEADMSTARYGEIEAPFRGPDFDRDTWRNSGTPEANAAKAIADEWVAAKNEQRLLRAELQTAEAATPGHPLVNTTDQWTTTAFRRLIRQAVEAGADYIALTPGKVQAERFNLAKQVQSLRYDPEAQALFIRPADARGGNTTGWTQMDGMSNVPPEKLPEFIGKDLAEKLLAEPLTMNGAWSGRAAHHLYDLQSLEIGGSGMKATYDSMYPRTLGKLLQKMDKDTKPQDMPLKSSVDGRTFTSDRVEERAQGWNNLDDFDTVTKEEIKGSPPIQFHTFPLTEKIKREVGGYGQALFAMAGEKAKTAPLSSRNLAESMERKGRDAAYILANTGWFRGADQKWRFEIDDSTAKIVNLDAKVTKPKAGFWGSLTGKRAPGVPSWAGKDVRVGLNIKLPEILQHEQLFKAYPMLRNMRVSIITGAGVPQAHEGGAFIYKQEGGKILYSPIQIKAKKQSDVLPYLMHEIQHYIQLKEGFTGGASSSGQKGDFPVLPLKYDMPPSKQLLAGNESFSTTTLQSQQDAMGRDHWPDWRSQIAGMNRAEQTALAIADLWDAVEKAPLLRGLISIDPSTRSLVDNLYREWDREGNPKHPTIDEAFVRDTLLPRLQADLMSQLRVTAVDYLTSIGEAEANAVMGRLNYTPEQRRTMLPDIPKGANTGQVTPDFREAAQAVLDSARKTQAIREKWLTEEVDLGDGVTVQRPNENSLAFSRAETWDWGADLGVELEWDKGRAILHFLPDALNGFKLAKERRPALTDAQMKLLADKAEAYVRSLNLLPTADIRLKNEMMDIPQTHLSEREVAFWKNRDPFFMPEEGPTVGGKDVMEWVLKRLDDGALVTFVGPLLRQRLDRAIDKDGAEFSEAERTAIVKEASSAIQEALHDKADVRDAFDALSDAGVITPDVIPTFEDFRSMLIGAYRAANAASGTTGGVVEMPMPVDYVTAKLDPEQWRIRDREAHQEPEGTPTGVWEGHKLRNDVKAHAIVYEDNGAWHGGVSGVHLPSMRGTLQTSPPLRSMNDAKVWVERALSDNDMEFEKNSNMLFAMSDERRIPLHDDMEAQARYEKVKELVEACR